MRTKDKHHLHSHLICKLVPKLCASPAFLRKATNMIISMMLYGRKEEVVIFFQLAASDKVFQELAEGKRMPGCILHNPLLDIFGRNLLALVKKMLEKEGQEVSREDVVAVSFLAISATFRYAGRAIFPEEPSGPEDKA